MKLMAVMIAVLFLISTTWAQGQSTEKGRESEPKPTSAGATIVMSFIEKYAQGL